MGRRLLTLTASLVTALVSPSALAYSLSSGFTNSCHEMITFQAIVPLLQVLDTERLELPSDPLWRSVGRALGEANAAESSPEAQLVRELDEGALFFLVSVIVGVRSPDTEGHAVTDINALRRIHANPDPQGQYAHALRSAEDDGIEGDLVAIEGAKEALRRLFDDFLRATEKPAQRQLLKVPFFLDFYGQIELEVNEPGYRLGRALHLVQDSYAHSLRTEDGSIILSVLNYDEAIAGELEEARDGLAHSEALDDCTGPIDVLTDRAKTASRGVALAAGAYFQGDEAALEAGLAPCEGDEQEGTCGWMTYNPPCEQALLEGGPDETCCTKDNKYCDTPWLETATKDATGPYLDDILSCVATPGTRPLGAGIMVMILFWGLRFMRRRSVPLGLLPASLLLYPDLAEAVVDPGLSNSVSTTAARPWFAAIDAHITLFNDAPNASLLNVGRGSGLTGGYRWGQWAFVANVGLDYWLATEVTQSLELGSLNIGVGAEHTFADDFLRTRLVVGPSILLLDTPLDDRGSIGAFAHFRPLGVRYRPYGPLRIVFDPLSVAYVAPVLGEGPTIQRIEYRTDVGLEFSW